MSPSTATPESATNPTPADTLNGGHATTADHATDRGEWNAGEHADRVEHSTIGEVQQHEDQQERDRHDDQQARLGILEMLELSAVS